MTVLADVDSLNKDQVSERIVSGRYHLSTFVVNQWLVK